MKTTLTLAALTLITLAPQAQTQDTTIALTTDEAESLYTTIEMSRVSVHDPSIILCPNNNAYYIFGSHLATAQSTDLQNWTTVEYTFNALDSLGNITENADYNDAFHYNQTTQITINNQTTTFGNFDAAAWNCAIPDTDDNGNETEWTVEGNMWAPDIIYNTTMNKYCLYLSLNGNTWNSCIILLTADNILGPYTYQGPVVYTGFNNDTNPNVSYHLTDLELVLGPQDTLPTRYNKGTEWGTYWPHAIDPCVFYDEEGNLRMTYGSWSGGIFMLELNEENGLRDYNVTYDTDYDTQGANLTTDAYFGTKIAGGYYVSGEGSYIEHIGNYYYLFLSYGSLEPDGGYEMRIFRSENPEGPYQDPQGNSAIYSSWKLNYGPNSDTRGEKILGAYNLWGFMETGECAQGHNSILNAPDGNTYLVYHTKFNDGTDGHAIRVHQTFLNSQDWLVAAPFEYNGETFNDDSIATSQHYTTNQLCGTYDIILHNYQLDHDNYEEMTPEQITLLPDSTIEGDHTGTWTLTPNSSYITLKLDNSTYYGIVTEQQMEPTTIKAITFTACNKAGLNLWAQRMEDNYALAYTLNNNNIPVTNNQTISSNIDLYGALEDIPNNVTAQWTSSNPNIISNTGRYNPDGLNENTPLTLTLTLTSGNYYWTESYNVTARAEYTPSGDWMTGIAAYYNCNETPLTNAYDETQTARLLGQNGNDKPTLTQDSIRDGYVLQQYYGDYGSSSYARFPNPLNDTSLDGVTISLWLKRADNDLWNNLWAFYNSSADTRLFLTGNSYIGFNNGTDWFDINNPNDNETDNIPTNEWTLLTLTISRTDGCTLYINGSRMRNYSFSGSLNGTTITNDDDFDYNLVIDFIEDCNYFFTGYGSFWGSADVQMDDILIYNRALSSTDARGLNTVSNRVYDFSPDATTAIESVKTGTHQSSTAKQGIYDLAGRRVTKPHKGIYIIDGKKMVIK